MPNRIRMIKMMIIPHFSLFALNLLPIKPYRIRANEKIYSAN
jgi:hypothetical protein